MGWRCCWTGRKPGSLSLNFSSSNACPVTSSSSAAAASSGIQPDRGAAWRIRGRNEMEDRWGEAGEGAGAKEKRGLWSNLGEDEK